METIFEQKKPKRNYKWLLLGVLIGVVLVGAIVLWALSQPTRDEQIAAALDGAFREGSPEFQKLTRDIIIATSDKTVESPNAFGKISMYIVGEIYNKGDKRITGLEVNVAVVDSYEKVLKEKRVLVVPMQVGTLEPGERIPITLTIDGFDPKDDRANIRWRVTAIRLASQNQ